MEPTGEDDPAANHTFLRGVFPEDQVREDIDPGGRDGKPSKPIGEGKAHGKKLEEAVTKKASCSRKKKKFSWGQR